MSALTVCDNVYTPTHSLTHSAVDEAYVFDHPANRDGDFTDTDTDSDSDDGLIVPYTYARKVMPRVLFFISLLEPRGAHAVSPQATLVLKLLVQRLAEYEPALRQLVEWYSCIACPMLHWGQRAEVLGRVAEMLDTDAAVRSVICRGGFLELPYNSNFQGTVWSPHCFTGRPRAR